MTDEPQIHVENDLEQCDSCNAHEHHGHVSFRERTDGSVVVCPCKGECDGSAVWPPPETL